MNKCLVICDESERRFFEVSSSTATIVFVTSDAELKQLSETTVNDYDGAVVVAELGWGNHMLSDYYGIDLAVLLRMRLKMLAPLCILSFMSKKHFERKDEAKYNILKARGTCFVQKPCNAELVFSELEKVAPLSLATLSYLSNLLVDMQHTIDLLRHDLRMKADHEKVSDALKRVDMLSTTGVYRELRDLADKVLQAHSDGDEDHFYSATNDLVTQLGHYWQQMKHTPHDQPATCSKIVVVDDNPDDLHWAKSALEKYFEVVPFQEAMDAKQYIDDDKCNEISAIISDWQLLKPGTDEHQEMLGFELLDYASKKGHYALFSLTSTDDSSTHEVDIYLEFEHTLITKDFHHDDSLWKMYIPIIRQQIDRQKAIVSSLPTGEAWNTDFKLEYRLEKGKRVAYKKPFKSFRQQYLEIRNSGEWHSFENGISTRSDQLWHYYKRAFDPEERCDLFDIKTQWGLELNRELKNMLVVRRLFLAFWFNKTKLDIGFRVPQKGWIEDPVINIYSVLRRRYFDEISDERGGVDDAKTYKDLNNAAKVFANQLAIEPNRLPQGILPEEKAWLKRVGVEVDEGNDNLYYND